MTTTNTNADSNIVETIFKTQEGYNECDHCQSVLSPAAYFVKLVETIEKYIPAHQLKTRRPDLFEIPLDCDSTNKTELYLEIVNRIMKDNLNSKLGLGIYALQKLANTNTKVNAHLQNNKLDDLCKNLSLARELGVSYEDCQSIISKETLKILATKYPSVDAYLKKPNMNDEDLYKKLSLIKTLDISREDYQLITSDVFEKLATIKYPFNLPANFPLISIRAYLEKQGISLADVYKVLKPDTDNTAESLRLSPEDYELIISPKATKTHLQEVCGLIGESLNQLKKVDKFITQTDIDYDKLERLLDCYNKIKKPSYTEKLTIDNTSETVNNETIIIKIISKLNGQSLCFLHRFIRIANKLNWSFDELSDVLITIDKNEIDANALKQISRIKSLQEKFKKPLVEICRLYSSSYLPDADSVAESLCLARDVTESYLKQVYGVDKLSESDLKKEYGIDKSELLKDQDVEKFIIKTGMDRNRLDRLLNGYNKIKKSSNLETRSTIKSDELSFLHRFIRLAEKLNKLKELFKDFSGKFKPKESIINVSERDKLQNILNIDDKELTSLIHYNRNECVSEYQLLEVCKQVLLARLMDISIAELIQILLQLNIDGLNPTNIECVVELNDWLKSNSITIEQLNTLVNSSAFSNQYTGQISKIHDELEKDQELKRDEKALYNTILQYIGESDSQLKSINEDILTATHKFTKKHATSLQLLKLESLNKSIVHNIGIIGNKAVFLGESKVHNKNPVEYSISEPRENVAVATTGTKTIFFGGKKSENDEYSRKIDIYDDETKSWTTETVSEARDSAAVAVVDKKAIFLGGNKDRGQCSSQIDILKYDDSTKKWTVVQSKAKEARANASVAVIGKKAVFFGGEVGQRRSSAIDIYDSADIDIYKTDLKERWKTHITSEARANVSVAVVDTKVIFFGGNKGGNQPSNKVDIYDAADIDIYKTDPGKRWTNHTMSEARENASVAIVDDKAIFFGGKTGQAKSNKIDIYDAKTEKWLEVEHHESEARDSASVIVVGKQAIFFGGCKGNQQYSKYIVHPFV